MTRNILFESYLQNGNIKEDSKAPETVKSGLCFLCRIHFNTDLFSPAFHKAGRRDQAVKVLEQLCHNAVVENRSVLRDFYSVTAATFRAKLV